MSSRRVSLRQAKHIVAMSNKEKAWICGFGLALAEMHRRLIGGNDSAGVVEVCSNAGLALRTFKAAGLCDYDVKELRKAGVPR